jgi:myo-inositol-1(or 4)-monophosphatase
VDLTHFYLVNTPPIINIMSSIMEKASRHLVRDFRELMNFNKTSSSINAFVNKAKEKTEHKIHDLIHASYPTATMDFATAGAIQHSENARMKWVINVLDGEHNFRSGLPHFAMSFAVFEDNRLTASFIFDPTKHDQFWAYKGFGAYWDTHRMRMQRNRQDGDVVLISNPMSFQRFTSINTLPFADRTRISWGSPALDWAYVAKNSYSGLLFQAPLSRYNIYAGLLLVKEAGGFASNRHSRFPKPDTDIMIAGNDCFYPVLMDHTPDSFFQENTPQNVSPPPQT